MAKINFSKFNLKKNEQVKNIEVLNQQIEIKQYLPIEEKLVIINNVVNGTIDGKGYYNPLIADMLLDIEMINSYTNIVLTDNQKGKDIQKTYDLLISNGIMEEIFKGIPQNEYLELRKNIMICLDNAVKYNSSIYGILDAVGHDYGNLNIDLNKIQEQISKGDGIELLKEIGPMVGLK